MQDFDNLAMEWQLEELDKQLEDLKQQATPKLRSALQIICRLFLLIVIHVIVLVVMNHW